MVGSAMESIVAIISDLRESLNQTLKDSSSGSVDDSRVLVLPTPPTSTIPWLTLQKQIYSLNKALNPQNAREPLCSSCFQDVIDVIEGVLYHEEVRIRTSGGDLVRTLMARPEVATLVEAEDIDESRTSNNADLTETDTSPLPKTKVRGIQRFLSMILQYTVEHMNRKYEVRSSVLGKEDTVALDDTTGEWSLTHIPLH